MAQPSARHTRLMPLPYALGVLHASVLKNQTIMENFRFPEYIFEKKTIAQALEQIEAPYAVFFSCYIWNYEYNKTLARAVKEKFPRCKIIFGGHQVPMDYLRAFREIPCADYILIGEGERIFEDLLLFFLGQRKKEELCNTAYRDSEGQPVCRMREDYVTRCLPSPYQCGGSSSATGVNTPVRPT